MTAPALHVGDWLDVVDGDGIWNVAQVIRLATPETVEVTYDCWGDEYNEVLRRDSDRIAPYHTHTWSVKCWAKLDTWPWWPAVLTVRTPGSALGAQNLRQEERLLVDFLDHTEFFERCRCWVRKSQTMALQSHRDTKKRLMTLKAQCDAREEFPKFCEGTLPVQFENNCTRPNTEVRIEMGEQLWMRAFADNRVSHAATHAYAPVLAGDEEGLELLKSRKTINADKIRTRCDASIEADQNSPSLDMRMADIATAQPKSTDVPIVIGTTTTILAAKDSRKRTNSNAGDAVCGFKSTSDTEEPRIESQRYGKTPKVLKISKASVSRPLSCTPGYAADLFRETSWDGKNTATPHIRHAAHSQLHATEGVPSTKLPVLDQHMGQEEAMMIEQLSGESSKPGNKSVCPIQSLARSTEAILQAYKKLRDMEAAVGGKLTELVEKTAKAEELWSRCADSPSFCSAQQNEDDVSDTLFSTFEAESETDRAIDESLHCESGTCGSPDALKCSSSARRAPQSKCRSASTLPAELDGTKTGLLACSNGQGAFTRMDHPSYGMPIHAGCSPHNGDSQEEVKWCCTNPFPQSVNQQLSGSWSRDHSSSTFSVNDNFSVSQWYRDLYPTSFDLERL
uniref:PWWP domain-containing protein n=1 Tax=Peronospora matthiolae TaxID=2874970 RepID=A0AAV1U0W6_9STRA